MASSLMAEINRDIIRCNCVLSTELFYRSLK
jgi:hypothetical protein